MHQPPSRTVRVFLSSTFRDFAEERDLLVRKVFPELRRRCRERQVELIDVDLRWGITEEEAQQGKVLPICLAEIDRARPYFMGFIGERYGWVPAHEHYDPSLLQEHPWIDEHRGGKSVTELEVLHGVLNNAAMTGRAFFYFRDPAYSQAKGKTYLTESTGDRQKLDALKERIRHSGFRVVEAYPSPEVLAEKVRDDLWLLIDEAFPADATPDPLAIERARHAAYSASRLGLYLGGEAYFRALDEAMAETESFRPVLITGASGGGKSALVANWCAAYTQTHPDTLRHLHHLGAGADAADPVKLVTRLLQEIARITGDELKLESDPQKLLDLLPEWLARASAYATRHDKEWRLVLDGLDKLSSLRDLRWWPAMLPPKVKLIASCLDGEVLESLRKRMEWTGLLVRPLSQAEQRTFITEFLGRYRKSLTPAQVERLLAHELSGNPLFLLTLLEELRVFGVHEKLEQRLSFYLTSETVDDLFERVLDRVEGDTSPTSVRSAMEAIWASRAGLAQDELLAITGLVPATWAPIHNALDEAILESGGRLNFCHDYFRKAVEDRYLPAPEQQRKAHLRLAEWFDTQEVNARVAEELPWQWQQAGADAKLKECLTRQEMFMALHERDAYELLGYWLAIKEESIEAAYEAAWETWMPKQPSEGAVPIALNLAGFLVIAGRYGQFPEKLYRFCLHHYESNLGLGLAETLNCMKDFGDFLLDKDRYEEAEALYRKALIGRETFLGPAHPDTLTSVNSIGNMLRLKGDVEGAEMWFRRSLSGRENSLGPEHSDTLSSINNLGMLLLGSGNYEEAELLLNRALQGKERVCGPLHPDTLMCVQNMGNLLSDLDDYEGAEVMYRRSLDGKEKVFGADHPNTLGSASNLGIVLLTKGDYEQAEALFLRSLQGYEKVYGPNHIETRRCLFNLGTLLWNKGDLASAELAYRRELSACDTIGQDGDETTQGAFNLGRLLRQAGKLQDAVELLSEYASKSAAAMTVLRYNLACYECLSGNEECARQLVTDELSTSDDPVARKSQMLEDADFQTIHDFIRSIPAGVSD